MTVNTNSLSYGGSPACLNRAEDWRPAAFTVEGWIKPTAVNVVQTLFAFSQNDMEFLLNSDGKLFLRIYNSGYQNVYSSGVLTASAWAHVGVKYNDSSKAYKFYIGGSPSGNGTIANSVGWEGGSAITRWMSRVNGDNYFVGKGDELRAWADERTDAEMAANYQTESPAGDNLYYMLHCNDGTGTTATDSSGGSRNFTLTGATLPQWDTEVPFGGSAIKTINGLARASVSTVRGLAIASVKTINGLA